MQNKKDKIQKYKNTEYKTKQQQYNNTSTIMQQYHNTKYKNTMIP